ncbi:MAG: pseudouridine synthase, partial [Pseudomonadota bacterium]
HKPVGRVCTHRDEKGRKTIFDALPAELGRVISVGRLDINSEGLLLLSNIGSIADYIATTSAWARVYRVRYHGHLSEGKIAQLRDGITVDGVRYGKIDVSQKGQKNTNGWVRVSLREGKNREVRKVLAACDVEVNRLIRVSFGPFQLGNMPRGAVTEITPTAMRNAFGPAQWQKFMDAS